MAGHWNVNTFITAYICLPSQLVAHLRVHIDGAVTAGLVKSTFPNIAGDAGALADTWRQVVDMLNIPLYTKWEEDTKITLNMVKNRLKYLRLDSYRPRLSEITEECAFVSSPLKTY